MRVNVGKLKMHPGASEWFDLSEDVGTRREIAGVRLLEPLRIEVSVQNREDDFCIRGRVRTSIQLSCSRCLKELAYPVDAEIQAQAPKGSGDAAGTDEYSLHLAGDEIDLLPAVEESLFLTIPLAPLCSEDCRGLCPICGTDKNTGTCTCQERETDPRWDRLKKLQ